MYKVLLLEPQTVGRFSNATEILEKEGYRVVKSPYPSPAKEKDLLKVIKDIDAIIAGGDELTAKVIESANKLKVITRYGTGVDTVDLEAASRKGVVVTVAPNQNAVADLTFGLMLCLARRICEANKLVKSGGWESPFVGVEVWQKTLGVVGAGRIGQAVIKRARGFDMRVLAYDIYQNEKLANQLGFEYVPLETLLRQADFVTLHVPLTDKTRGLIGDKEIRLMKPSAYLINIARGGLVDEQSLYLALKEKRLAGAALDVHAQEPPSPDSSLLKLDNVITTPHMGSYTKESMRSMALVCAENIIRVLRGRKPLYALNFPLPQD